MAFISNFYVFAIENEDKAIEKNEEYISQAPWKYGEMKDGLFVRETSIEEMSWISPDDPNYLKEYQICIESRKLEELTPEMKALGYDLFEGHVITQKGDPPFSEKKVKIQDSKAEKNMESFGQVTFNGIIDSDISETCFIEVKNKTTEKIYLIELYHANNYMRTIYFPEGEYIPLTGGIYNDYTNKYPFSSEGFVVKNGSFSYVDVKIGYSNSEKEIYEQSTELEENDETEIIVSEENKKNTWKSLFFSAITPIILIGLSYIGIKYYKHWRNN